jgi:uncharacterized protein
MRVPKIRHEAGNMNASQWFMHSDGRLRAGWRLLLFIVCFLLAFFPFQWSAGAVIRSWADASRLEILAVSTSASLLAVFAATWLMMRLIEHQSFSAVGLTFGKRSPKELGLGLASGAGMVGTIAAVEWAAGAIHFEQPGADASATFVSIAATAAFFALSAANEELLFRGYPFQRMVEGTRDYSAAALFSVLFGALHKFNPHATNLSLANTVLAGMLLSVAYLKTRALWLPLGFHFSWNWALSLWGLPISGIGLGKMPWLAVPAGSRPWISGGDYGPEGGAVATAVLFAGLMVLIRFEEKAPPSPAISAGDPKVSIIP